MSGIGSLSGVYAALQDSLSNSVATNAVNATVDEFKPINPGTGQLREQRGVKAAAGSIVGLVGAAQIQAQEANAAFAAGAGPAHARNAYESVVSVVRQATEASKVLADA